MITMNHFKLPALLIGLVPASMAIAAEPAAVHIGVEHTQEAIPSSTYALPVLPTVEVMGNVGLGLSQTSTSGSRTGITTRDLPASLDYVDEQTWQERGDSRMADIIGRTVGMTALSPTSYGSLNFSARGFTGTNSVGIAEDGVKLGVASSTTPYPSDSWGYERVEVLRGPASILYGSGTVGATANVVRKQPTRELMREVMVGAGSYDTGRLGLGMSGPLGETLSYRMDVYGHTSSGEHAMSQSHGSKFMSTLRWQPSGVLRAELLVDSSDQKPARYFGTPTLNGRIVKSLLGRNFNTQDSAISIKDQRVRARVEYQLNDKLTVRNELYHFKADRYWRNIEAYSYRPATQQIKLADYLELSHDLDQTGNRLEAVVNAGTHKLVLGWEVSKAKFRFARNDYAGSDTIGVNDPRWSHWPNTSPLLPNFRTEATTHDFYVEDAWSLSDRWLLLGGIRQGVTDMSRYPVSGVGAFDTRLHGTAWRLGSTYALNAHTNLYGQFTQGHDPVGNILTLNTTNKHYKLTTARQVEVGLKQQSANGHSEWTVAAYRIEKNDIVTTDQQTKLQTQGGKQYSQGLELTAALRLTPHWRIDGNLALLDAQYGELIKSGQDLSGKTPSNVAHQTANLWVHYNTVNAMGYWQASLGARAVSTRFADDANTSRSPGYTVWDAALSWNPSARTTYRLTVRNLTDKLYTYSAVSSAVSNSGAGQAYPGEGRRFDVTAEFAF